jgi:AcrR family transcriptional regulator
MPPKRRFIMPKDTFFNLNEEKQENIMRTAINEFSNHGFEKGNIGEIAKSAGVAKGSMYQYFENKKELFLYSVQWSIELFMKKYHKYLVFTDKEINFFDYLYETSKALIIQMRDERELVIFIQDVFLGKYKNLTDESMEYMTKVSDEYMLQYIRQGKENGYIRKDIDDKLLCIFAIGVSYKFKEYIMNKARILGEDIIDEPFEAYENELKSLIELMKYGMMGGIK